MNIKDWMVWAENYLLWGMVAAMGILLLFFVWEGVNDYRTFSRIMNSEISFEEEPVIGLLNLKLAGVRADQTEEGFRYITITGLSYSLPPHEIASTLEHADGSTKIIGLESYPSFLLNDGHEQFWKTQFIYYLILHYGAWIAMCIFFGAFGYLNLKQQDKLLTKEIGWIIQGAFFLFLSGYIIYQFINNRIINFLNEEFQLGESTGAFMSGEIYFTVLTLFLAYIIIAKAVPIQQEQDLTV